MAKALLHGVLPGILENIQDIRLRGGTPIVVFDLDDTLFSRRNRHMRILEEFARDAAVEPRMRAAARLLIETGDHNKWSIADAAKAAGIDAMAMRKAMHHFWSERFHHHEYLTEDAPVAGAPEYIRALLGARAVVVFITRRTFDKRDEVLASFARDGFPVPGAMPWRDRARLILRPRLETHELPFKIDVMKELAKEGTLVACFENHIDYARAMAREFPAMTAVQLGRARERAQSLPDGVTSIPDFLPHA